jgi:Tfp pilus assembly protein PilE
VTAAPTENIPADTPGPNDAACAASPTPPTLHWALVWLFAIATLGMFALAWSFVQARWVRLVDPRSNAQKLLGIGTGGLVAGAAVTQAGAYAARHGLSDAVVLLVDGRLLMLGWLVLYVVAHFSMADSTRRHAASQGIALEVSGGTLFLFTVLYLQGLLSWLARCEASGETSPAAPKGVFWVLSLLLAFLLGILAAIALPSYANHAIRAQLSEGEALATPAKAAMLTYYGRHHALPIDNLAAGLARSTSISGRYVSGVNVAGGAVTVTFDTPNARRDIRHQALVYFPVIEGDIIRWDCHAYSTVPDKDLPPSCQK